MSKQNGGIIGPDNVPTGAFGAASGVWKLSDVTNYKRQGTWPVALSGHQVANSCRFDDGSSDYLTESVSSTSNRRTFTYSAWIKRSSLSDSGYPRLFNPFVNSANFFDIFFRNTDALNVYSQNADSNDMNLVTNKLFRDFSAWYHIVVAVDTTQGTDSNRVKLYVNGTQETSFSASTYPSQNTQFQINLDTVTNVIGRNQAGSDNYFDGYMSEIVFVDGSQLAPTSFGEFNSQTGIWIPKDVSGLTFGTNGFYLDFKDSSALGNDAAGSNNFTANNLTSLDQSIDTCTNNFATGNFINSSFGSLLKDGNLVAPGNTSSTDRATTGTIGISSGKWYWEAKWEKNNSSFQRAYLGIVAVEQPLDVGANAQGNTSFKNTIWDLTGNLYKNGADTGDDYTVTVDSIVGYAIDLDNGTLKIHENGTYFNSGNAVITGLDTSITYVPYIACNGGSTFSTLSMNFGSPTLAISSGNVDSSGMGNFEYAVPSGYYSLCTRNLNLIG